MKQQKYAKSLAKGSVLFIVNCYVTNGGGRCVELEEWHVTSIQSPRRLAKTRWDNDDYVAPKYVYIRAKIPYITCDKNGDWHSSCNREYKKEFKVGNDLPIGIYSTKLQAMKYAVYDCEDTVKWCEDEVKTLVDPDPDELAEWKAELEDHKVLLRMAKGKLTKLRKVGK